MQLPLDLGFRNDATFENFVKGDNRTCVEWLTDFIVCKKETFSYGYLFGPSGSGRTHLLWSACHLAQKLGLSVASIPLVNLLNKDSSVLEGLENLEVSCFSGVEAIAGNAAAEEALFHAFNRCQLQSKRLLISGESSPVHSPLQLPDLRSRLASGVSFAIKPLTEAQSVEALQLRAKQRGFVLPEAVGFFLLKRWPRSMRELVAALETLDSASLAQQRALTIPFVKSVLAL